MARWSTAAARCTGAAAPGYSQNSSRPVRRLLAPHDPCAAALCAIRKRASNGCAMAGDYGLHSVLLPCRFGRTLGTKHVAPQTAFPAPEDAVLPSYINAGMRLR